MLANILRLTNEDEFKKKKIIFMKKYSEVHRIEYDDRRHQNRHGVWHQKIYFEWHS